MSRERSPVQLTIRFRSGFWRLRSADGRLSGVFTDIRSATRWALDEIASHPGYSLCHESAELIASPDAKSA